MKNVGAVLPSASCRADCGKCWQGKGLRVHSACLLGACWMTKICPAACARRLRGPHQSCAFVA